MRDGVPQTRITTAVHFAQLQVSVSKSRSREGAFLLVVAVLAIFAIGLLLDSVTHQRTVASTSRPRVQAVVTRDPGAFDDFGRANSTTTLGTTPDGVPWRQTSGGWGVSAHAAYVAQPSSSHNLALVDGVSADVQLSVVVAKIAPGIGVAFRCRDEANCWHIETEGAARPWSITRTLNGVDRSVGDLGNARSADGDELAVDLDGPVLTFSVNRVRITSIEDPALKDETSVGLWLRSAPGARTARWTNLRAAINLHAGIIDLKRATFVDRFDRSDRDELAHTTQVPNEWRSVKGQWGIRDHHAQPIQDIGIGANLALIDTGRSDGVIEATLLEPQQAIGIAFRCRDSDNCWRLEAAVGFGTWNVSRVVGGVVTKVVTLGVQPTSAGTTVSIRLDGTHASAFINGKLAARFEAPEFVREQDAGLVVASGADATSAKWGLFATSALGAQR